MGELEWFKKKIKQNPNNPPTQEEVIELFCLLMKTAWSRSKWKVNQNILKLYLYFFLFNLFAIIFSMYKAVFPTIAIFSLELHVC